MKTKNLLLIAFLTMGFIDAIVQEINGKTNGLSNILQFASMSSYTIKDNMELKEMLIRPMGVISTDLRSDTYESIKASLSKEFSFKDESEKDNEHVLYIWSSQNSSCEKMNYRGLEFDNFRLDVSASRLSVKYQFKKDKSDMPDAYQCLNMIVRDFNSIGIPLSYKKDFDQNQKAHGYVSKDNADYRIELYDWGAIWDFYIYVTYNNRNSYSSSSTTASSSSSSSSSSTYSSSSSSSSSSTTTSSDSQYGNLLWSGTYTVTGKGFRGMEATIVSAPFLVELQIFEKVLICNKTDFYDYVGTKEAYYMKGRQYKNRAVEGTSIVVTDQGVPFIYNESVQSLPFVGNVMTTAIIYMTPGDTRSAYIGGGFNGGVNNNGFNDGINNGGTYNAQPRQRICNHCHGTGNCPNCSGSGWVVSPYGNVKGRYPCVNCNPNGNSASRGRCPVCGGTGRR